MAEAAAGSGQWLVCRLPH